MADHAASWAPLTRSRPPPPTHTHQRWDSVLWYNLNFHHRGQWGEAVRGEHDQLIAEWATAVGSVEPALVYVRHAG